MLLTEAAFQPDEIARQQEMDLEEDGEWGLVSSGVSCSLVFSGINI